MSHDQWKTMSDADDDPRALVARAVLEPGEAEAELEHKQDEDNKLEVAEAGHYMPGDAADFECALQGWLRRAGVEEMEKVCDRIDQQIAIETDRLLREGEAGVGVMRRRSIKPVGEPLPRLDRGRKRGPRK